jgi:hypothetical protein
MMLTYRDKGTSGTQIEVLSSELRIATIRKDFYSVTSGGGEVWHWDMISPHGPSGYHQHGGAASLAAAKADVERMWWLWLEAAGLRPI